MLRKTDWECSISQVAISDLSQNRIPKKRSCVVNYATPLLQPFYLFARLLSNLITKTYFMNKYNQNNCESLENQS